MVLQAGLPREEAWVLGPVREVPGMERPGKGRVKAEKEYTKNAIYRDKVNRGDYEKEGWMAHKGQRSRRRK